MVSTYFLASILWSVAGFIIGFVAGKLGAKYQLEHHMKNDNNKSWYVRFLEKVTLQSAFGVVILILIAVGMTSVVQGNARLEQVVKCQTAFNQEYTKGLQARSDAAASEREAQRELLAVTNDPASNDEQRSQAIDNYVVTLNQADQQRRENPIPSLPAGCNVI